ncbi:MAG: anaerobic glycerol-3-phosphate dehydrogenase subunit C [Desulfomonilia bacterium]
MSFEHCVRCTICVENCPVYKVEPRFPGPKQSGPDAQRFRLDGEKSVDQWVKYCCQCRRCQVACPYGVEVAEIILKAQLKYGAEHISPFSAHLFANAYHLNALGSTFAPLANKAASWNVIKSVLNLLGVSREPDLPEFRFINLERGRRRKGKGRKVAFFYGCHLSFNRPDIGRKIRDLLVSMGCRVVMPRQTCCGLPALGNGDVDMAKKYAHKNAVTLTSYINRGFDVVYACTSCGLTLMQDYPGVLEAPGGKKIAENTYNVSEYLLSLLQEDNEKAPLGRLEKKIAYHIPCHLRALGIGYPAAKIFEQIDGLECFVLDEDCCGLAGTYGFKKRNETVSHKLGEIASTQIRDLHVDAVVADCGACRMQLGHFTNLPALDPVEIMMEAIAGKAGNKRKSGQGIKHWLRKTP